MIFGAYAEYLLREKLRKSISILKQFTFSMNTKYSLQIRHSRVYSWIFFGILQVLYESHGMMNFESLERTQDQILEKLKLTSNKIKKS